MNYVGFDLSLLDESVPLQNKKHFNIRLLMLLTICFRLHLKGFYSLYDLYNLYTRYTFYFTINALSYYIRLQTTTYAA